MTTEELIKAMRAKMEEVMNTPVITPFQYRPEALPEDFIVPIPPTREPYVPPLGELRASLAAEIERLKALDTNLADT